MSQSGGSSSPLMQEPAASPMPSVHSLPLFSHPASLPLTQTASPPAAQAPEIDAQQSPPHCQVAGVMHAIPFSIFFARDSNSTLFPSPAHTLYLPCTRSHQHSNCLESIYYFNAKNNLVYQSFHACAFSEDCKHAIPSFSISCRLTTMKSQSSQRRETLL